MAITAEKRSLLEEVLGRLYASLSGAFPRVQDFRLAHARQRAVINELVEHGYLKLEWERYVLTRKGLLECHSATAKDAIEEFDSLLHQLKEVYRRQPGHTWNVAELAQEVARPAPELARTLALFNELPIHIARGRYSGAGRVKSVQLTRSVLDIEPLGRPEQEAVDGTSSTAASLRIDTIELTGYRPSSGFSAQPRDLTVIIGANASGKSSLFDFLRFASFAASNPSPPETDPRSVGRRLFHVARSSSRPIHRTFSASSSSRRSP